MITLDLEPAEIQSVNRPIVYDVSSDRFGSEALAVPTVSVEPSAPFAGNARFNFAGPHPYQIGDLVTGTGFAIGDYNRQHVVLKTIGNTLTTDILFLGNDSGTLTRTNNNFRIKADIGVFDDVAVPKVAIASAVAAGAFTELTTAAPHLLEEGNILEITETTTYDGNFEIEDGSGFIISPTQVIIKSPFIATTTGFLQHAPRLGLIRQQVTVENALNKFRFSVAGLLGALITGDLEDLDQSPQIFTPTPNSIKRYMVLFTEEYDLKPGIANIDPESDRTFGTTPVFALNNTNQHREVQDVDRFLLDGVFKKFLTNSPDRIDMAFDEEFQLSFITDIAEVDVEFEPFDLNGNSLGINTATFVPTTVVDKRAIVVINKEIFLEVHSRLDIWIVEGESQISETKRFDKDTRCYRQPIRFHWLNRAGGYDAYSFTGDFQETLKSSKSIYQKDIGITVEKDERGKTVLGVADDPTFMVFSELLNFEKRKWLEELITSPDVLMEEGGDFIPVIVTNKSTPIDRVKPTQLRLQWREANELIIQKGV